MVFSKWGAYAFLFSFLVISSLVFERCTIDILFYFYWLLYNSYHAFGSHLSSCLFRSVFHPCNPSKSKPNLNKIKYILKTENYCCANCSVAHWDTICPLMHSCFLVSVHCHEFLVDSRPLVSATPPIMNSHQETSSLEIPNEIRPPMNLLSYTHTGGGRAGRERGGGCFSYLTKYDVLCTDP